MMGGTASCRSVDAGGVSEVADGTGATEADPLHDPLTGDVVGMALGDQPPAPEEPRANRQNSAGGFSC